MHLYILAINYLKKDKENNPIYNKIKNNEKYLEINLTKEMKGLYLENYNTLMKETEDDTKIWKDILCSWIGRTNIVKMSILPKAI